MRRLTTLLDTSMTYRYPRESARLGEVLKRAAIVGEESTPEGVVGMGTRVFCADDGGDPREVSLVFPWDEDRFHGQLSVLSPLGVALLGVRAGESCDWTDEDGIPHTTRVLHVSAFGRD